MRPINADRRRHVLSLAKRVGELITTRRKLVTEVQELDTQARNMIREHNTLYNLDAPTSNVPDEILAMIFEAGMRLEPESESLVHFGALVSQISHRWRSVALATQRLWTYIHIGDFLPTITQIDSSESQGWRDIASVHLSRSGSLPVDIHIKYLMVEDLIGLSYSNSVFGALMKRCRRLIINPHVDFMPLLLGSLSCHCMPLLRWISLSPAQDDPDGMEEMEFEGPFFPLGSPALRTVHIDRINIMSLPSCLLDLSFLTSLRLTNLFMDSDEKHDLFRDGLTSLEALKHLELEFDYFDPATVATPMVLPTLRFLRVDVERCYGAVPDAIASFCADSLISLSLKGWSDTSPASALAGPHFPSLRHLILVNYKDEGDLPSYDRLGTTFPDIKRLTFSVEDDVNGNIHHPNFDDMLAAIQWDLEGAEDASEDMRWEDLEIIAISDINLTNPANVQKMCYILAQMQEYDRPIRKLLIPPGCVARGDAESMAKLQDIIKIVDFKVRWPTPFERKF